MGRYLIRREGRGLRNNPPGAAVKDHGDSADETTSILVATVTFETFEGNDLTYIVYVRAVGLLLKGTSSKYSSRYPRTQQLSRTNRSSIDALSLLCGRRSSKYYSPGRIRKAPSKLPTIPV